MTKPRLSDIESRNEAATGTSWHWAGNTDNGEPYLATWIPGAGRCQILEIGWEERSTTGREADRVRATAREFDLGDPEECVEQWAFDQFGEPMRDPRLCFAEDLMMVDARDRVIYEVAPEATSREDPKVYRADISGIRHPDAEFIAHSRQDIRVFSEFVRDLIGSHIEMGLLEANTPAHDGTKRSQAYIDGYRAAQQVVLNAFRSRFDTEDETP